jgi:hypothetical protein
MNNDVDIFEVLSATEHMLAEGKSFTERASVTFVIWTIVWFCLSSWKMLEKKENFHIEILLNHEIGM